MVKVEKRVYIHRKLHISKVMSSVESLKIVDEKEGFNREVSRKWKYRFKVYKSE